MLEERKEEFESYVLQLKSMNMDKFSKDPQEYKEAGKVYVEYVITVYEEVWELLKKPDIEKMYLEVVEYIDIAGKVWDSEQTEKVLEENIYRYDNIKAGQSRVTLADSLICFMIDLKKGNLDISAAEIDNYFKSMDKLCMEAVTYIKDNILHFLEELLMGA